MPFTLVLLLACWAPSSAFLVVPTVQHRAMAPQCALTHRASTPTLCAQQQQSCADQKQQRLPQSSFRTAIASRTKTTTGWVRRQMRRVVTFAAIGSASVLMRRPTDMPPAHAITVAAKQQSSGKVVRPKARKSNSGSTALTTLTMFGGMAFFCYRQAALEDEEEKTRIKDENENMQRMSKEFTDIDEGVAVDADLLASLKKRLNQTETSGSKSDGDSDGDGDGGAAPPTASDDDKPPDSGGGAAILERPEAPSPPPAPRPEPPTASAEDIERMKRMFGNPDAEK